MTVSSSINKVSYAGDSTTTVFSVSFYFFNDSDLQVVLRDSDGIETVLVLTTDYSVSGAGNVAGGGIALAVAPATGETLVIAREVALTQQTDYLANDPFPAETHERALDKLTMATQQIQEQVDRSAKLPISDPASADSLVADLVRVADSIDNVDTVATNITNVNTTATNIANVNTVAGISGNVTTVAGISANVTTVVGISANVTTVAGINADVTTVAGISASVTAVAADDTDIGVVATNLSGTDTIGTVAGIAANVTTVAGIAANVTTVAGISADVTAVAADATDIGAVATNIANVNTVSTNIANVNTVAGISADVTSVAADATDIGTVATNIANVTTVAGISANVTTVAGIGTNVTTVAGISPNVTTVAGIAANVTTVAGLSADVTAVAADATDIGTVATSIANVNSVGTNIASVNTVAGGIANVNTVATNIADVGTVAGISANVSTVAGISSNVTTVAGVAGDLNAVALTVAPVEAMLPVAFDIPTLWWDTGDRLLSGASERLIISNWQVTSLFDTEEGGWYDTYDATELGGATVAGDVVPSLGDKSGNTNDATGENVLYATVPRPALYNNGVSSRMIVDLPYLGNNATIAYCSDQGVTILTGRNVGGSTDILHDRYLFGYVVIDRALTAQETLRLTQYLESRKYGYVAPAEYDGAVLLEDGFSLLMENDDRVDLEGVISYPLSV